MIQAVDDLDVASSHSSPRQNRYPISGSPGGRECSLGWDALKCLRQTEQNRRFTGVHR
jgi:hypothetical protein